MNLSEQINENLKLELNNNSNVNESQSLTCHSLPVETNNNIKTEEENNYYYNDQINNEYKPINIKKETTKKQKYKDIDINKNLDNYSHKNKPLSCEVLNKKAPKKKKTDIKSRDNYSLIQEGSILKEQSELDFISKRIHNNKYKIIFNLLYKASEDKDKSSIFHKNCDRAQTTLILVETKKGFRFGGFTKRTWRGSSKKTDNDAFIFSVNKRTIYNVIKKKEAIGCFGDFGPFFIGGFKISDNAFEKGGCCFKKGVNYETNNDYELNGGEELFDINDIEVYEIKIA